MIQDHMKRSLTLSDGRIKIKCINAPLYDILQDAV